MDVTPEVRPVTCCGVMLSTSVPPALLPSWPTPFLPQHRSLPLTVAQVWLSPAAMAVTPVVRPTGITGMSEALFELLPSSP